MFAQCAGSWTTQPSASSSVHHSRTKDLIHLDIQLLGPSPQYVHDDVELYDLVAWLLSGKLPPQWFVLLSLLSVPPRTIVQPRTAHFHSQYPLHLVVYKSRIHPVGSDESVFCVNRHIPECLSVC